MLKTTCWILLLLIVLPAGLAAQPSPELGMPILRTYVPRDIDVSKQIWNIMQDRRGVLYFGGTRGIFEYDGANWRKIRISSNVVRSLAQDADGKIWIGVNGSFGTLEPDRNGSMQYLPVTEKIPAEHRDFTDVWQVLLTPKAKYFRSYQRLFRWDGQRMQVWVSKSRFEALSEVRGRIYTAQGGIGLQEIVGDELRGLTGGEAYKSFAKLFMHPYDERRILISARNSKLSLYDGEKSTPFPTQADAYLEKNDLYVSVPLPDGGFCLTTLRGGAVIIDHDGRLRRTIDKETGLADSNVLSAMMDRDGALWLGQGGGIARVNVGSQVSLFTMGLPAGLTRHQGTLYVASANGGIPLSKLVSDPATGVARLQPIPTNFNQAWTLLSFKDPAAKVPPQLLLASGNGVMKIDGDKISALIAGLEGVTQAANGLLLSRKNPNQIFVSHLGGYSSIRWESGKWKDEGRVPKFSVGLGMGAEDSYSAADLKLLNTIALQTASAIENSILCAEMVGAVRDREQLASIQKELDTARTIQLSLIPRVFPPFPDRKDFELHAQMTAARSVGGDFFDFFLIDSDHLGVVIGDVSGKGIPAALYMAVARTQIKTTALTGVTPEECLGEVNRGLMREKASSLYSTCFYGILNTRTLEFRYCNAGHNPPLVLRAQGLEHLNAEGGLPLGLFAGFPYSGAKIQLEPGDSVFLFTDGVSEANNLALDDFGDERLEKLVQSVAHLPCEELVLRVNEEVLAFVDGAPQSDDITMVSFRVRGI